MQELKNTPIFFIDVRVGVEVVHPRFFFSTLTRLRRWCESAVNLPFTCLLQEPEMCLRLKVPMKCLTHQKDCCGITQIRYELEKLRIIFAVCDLVLKLANHIVWLHLRPPDTDYFFHKKDLRFFFGEVGVCITKGISFIWRPLILRFIYCYFFAGIKDKSF